VKKKHTFGTVLTGYLMLINHTGVPENGNSVLKHNISVGVYFLNEFLVIVP
jgi:hypothetical protein